MIKLFSLLNYVGEAAAAPAADSRRTWLHGLGRALVAAAPLALAAAPTARAATDDTSFDSVLLLLHLERLQLALYTQALDATGLVPAAQLPDVQHLQAHQRQHEAFLRQNLTDAGATVPASPAFDFTGRRNSPAHPALFPNVFGDFKVFLALAQALEDFGVRLYKAQLANLVSNRQLYTAVLRMHLVEARHSAHIRTLRRNAGATAKSWPSNADAPLTELSQAPALTDTIKGEEQTLQYLAGPKLVPFTDLLTAANGTSIQDPALAEAFDEPLDALATALGTATPAARAQAVFALFSN